VVKHDPDDPQQGDYKVQLVTPGVQIAVWAANRLILGQFVSEIFIPQSGNLKKKISMAM
jgi:hypothetical protein